LRNEQEVTMKENDIEQQACAEAIETAEYNTNPAVLAKLQDRTNELKGRAKYVYTSLCDKTLAVVLKACQEEQIVPEWATVCLLGHHAGVFASTVVNLEWVAISFDRGTMKYIEKWGGHRVPYEVPLPPEVLSYLEDLRKKMPKAQHLCPILRDRTSLCDRWALVVEKLRLPRISLSSMCGPYRRTYVRRQEIVANIRAAIKLTRCWLGDAWVNVFLDQHAKPLLEKEGLDTKNFGLFPLNEKEMQERSRLLTDSDPPEDGATDGASAKASQKIESAIVNS
jgi:integrase